MNKKYIPLLGIAIVVIAGFWVAASPKEETERVIGMTLAISGPNASIGERVRNGAMLAFEQYQQGADNKVTVVVEDDQSEAKMAVTAFQKLIGVDGAEVVLGPLRSDQVLAVAPLANEAHIVELSPTGGADEITTAGDYVFRNIETGEAHGKGAARLMQERGLKSVYVLDGNAANAKTYSAHFKSNAAAVGLTISGESSYEAKQNDYRTQVLKAIETKPDAVYIGVTTAPDAGLLVKQMRSFGFAGTIVMSVAADAKEFFDIAGNNSGETYVTGSPLAESDQGKAFVDAYKERYGSEADGFAANGYDAMNMALDALEECKPKDDECIKNYLYDVKGYEGAGGTLTFDSNGDVSKDVQVKRALEGKFVVVGE